MSAWIVSKKHIDTLVELALPLPKGDVLIYHTQEGECRRIGGDSADVLGQLLIDENVKSVCYRYNEPSNAPDLPGPVEQYWLQPYQFPVFSKRVEPVVGLKALACYEYQSCEHPEWRESEAYHFCQALRKRLITHLPGYDAAPWGID